jgi:hypothetical protein
MKSNRLLSITIIVLAVVVCVFKAIDSYLMLRYIGAVKLYRDGLVHSYYSKWQNLAEGVVPFGGLLHLSLYTLLIIWTYRVYFNIHRLDNYQPENSLNWSVIGWIFPALNFIYPYRIISESYLEYQNQIEFDAYRTKNPILIWWILFMFSYALIPVIITFLGGNAAVANPTNGILIQLRFQILGNIGAIISMVFLARYIWNMMRLEPQFMTLAPRKAMPIEDHLIQ